MPAVGGQGRGARARWCWVVPAPGCPGRSGVSQVLCVCNLRPLAAACSRDLAGLGSVSIPTLGLAQPSAPDLTSLGWLRSLIPTWWTDVTRDEGRPGLQKPLPLALASELPMFCLDHLGCLEGYHLGPSQHTPHPRRPINNRKLLLMVPRAGRSKIPAGRFVRCLLRAHVWVTDVLALSLLRGGGMGDGGGGTGEGALS